MSGFATIYYRDGRSADAETLGAMMESLAHRGPNGKHAVCRECIGMGHLLLATGRGEAREEMPGRSADGRLTITGDLRLDEPKELWEKLGLRGAFDPSVPDSQLVLLAYDQWGEACPFHLLGDFAFVIWDSRKQLLFAARDPFGVKPFYYHLSDNLFAAASEIKALLRIDEIDGEMDETWLLDYLAALPLDGEATAYRSIRRLPAATSLTIQNDRLHRERYWRLDPHRRLNYSSDEACIEAFRALFLKAVDRRLTAGQKTGGYLSGGIDSSSIVCAASDKLKEEGRGPLFTYSGAYSESCESDESGYIQSVVARGNVKSTVFDASQAGPLTDIEPILACLDEPRLAYNLYVNWRLLGTARDSGVRIMLDGFDGDSTLSHGQGLFGEWAKRGQWLTLMNELRPYCEKRDLPFWSCYGRSLWDFGIRPRLPESLQSLPRMASRLRKGLRSSGRPRTARQSAILDADFSLRTHAMQRIASAAETQFPDHQRCHLEKLESIMLPSTLEVLDALSAGSGIEPRYPFFDRDLVEFSLAVPWRLKLKRGYSRVIIRRALSDVLPPSIRDRFDKADMGHGFTRNLNRHNRALILDQLASASGLAEWIEPEAIRRLREGFLAERCSGDELMLIWRLVALNVWTNRSESRKMLSVA